VSDFDFILYITADQSACPTSSSGQATTVAFATACANEATQDRPIAGAINFCPDGVRSRDPDFAFAVTKHEVFHAIGFSTFLFALWRNPTNNEPRTPRNADSDLPNVGSDG
jgi:leishmanolysin-like peptidase